MNSQNLFPADTISAYNMLINKIADFAYPITDDIDLDEYLDEFFGVSELQMDDEYLSDDQEEFFWEWLWYDIPIFDGKTVVETYILEHEDHLTQGELAYLIGIQKSYRSCFEVLDIKRDFGFEVKDIFTEEIFFISEVKGSYLFEKGNFLFARLIPLKGTNVFSGALSLIRMINDISLNDVLDLERKIIGFQKSYREFLKRYGGILYQKL